MNGAAALIWRSRLRRRGRAWVALALLLGLGTGTGLACLAGARRTASAFDRFAADTGFFDVNVSHGLPPAEADALADRVTGVARHATVVGFTGFVEDLDPTLFQYFVGSVRDRYHSGRPLLRFGRYPRADRADEVLLTGRGVDASGVKPGDELSLRLFTSDFSEMVTRRVVVTGTAVDVEVVTDRSQNRGSVRLTPAFTAANADRLGAWSATAFVADASTSVERDLLPQLRELDWSIDETRSAFQGRVQAALRPLGATLALLGGLLLLATVVVVGQALGRQAEAGRSEAEATRAMGFTAGQGRLVRLATVLTVAMPGALAGIALALAFSPLFPTGEMRVLDPARGVDVDLAVLGLGTAAVLVLVLVTDGLVVRRGRRSTRAVSTPRVALLASSRPVASAGLGLALGATTGQRRRFQATVSSSAVALTLVVAAIAFVSALDLLSAHPARYGVGWELTARNAYGEVPPDEVRALVAGDRDIEAVAGASVTSVLVDDEVTVPALAMLPITDDLWPTLVEGFVPRNDNEILAGAAALDALDAGIGDTVELRHPYFSPRGAQVTIVGTAVFPSVDIPGVDPTRLDNGLAMTWGRYQALQAGTEEGDTMPDLTFFDLADGVDPQAVITRYADGLPELTGVAATEWLVSLAPLEVVETGRAGGLIWTVVGLLGVTVVATIGHGLVAGVRQRRGDYGVLKALGFTRRQVVGAVMWQSTVAVAIALVVAIPLGAALGRWAWSTFAQSIGVIDTPVVPVLGLATVVAGALLASGLVASLPAAVAARTAPATALRQE